ncbi:MAG TPA: uroporphyrinogen decarboxylase family protein, partial [Armatimonadota bacterium]|nr:uroporphyrinogen decarboxylase family protein [Armatimonadota bacterium]
MRNTPVIKWLDHADLAVRLTPTVGRAEYLDHMTFVRNDRPLFTEPFGPLIGLKEEWEAQGASPGELDLSAFRFRCPAEAYVHVNTGWMGETEEEVIEETDQLRIYRDSMGRTMKLIKGFATLALPLDFPVKTMDDWRRIRHHYEFSEQRFAAGWEAAAREHLARDRVLCAAIPGGYDTPRQLMGDAAACVAYHDDPELMHDILDTLTETAVRVLDRVSRTVAIDQLSVHEDMAGKSGPLAGPSQVREFIAPYYRRVWDMLADRGTRLFDQDSDGNMNAVIDEFLDAGINLMHPIEPAAGMDIVALRERYGRRLAFCGGLDKHVLRRSREEIDAELERKIPPLVATGGCMLG